MLEFPSLKAFVMRVTLYRQTGPFLPSLKGFSLGYFVVVYHSELACLRHIFIRDTPFVGAGQIRHSSAGSRMN